MTETCRPVVCVLDDIHPAALARIAETADLRLPADSANWREVAEGVIVRGTPVTEADLKAARRLKVVGKHGTGIDNIDAAAAAREGIQVRHTPGANAPSVADLAVGMALSLIRNLHRHTEALRAGTRLKGAARSGFELGELTCGIVGVGAVGKLTAHRLVHGFGARVVGYDPHLAADQWPEGVTPVTSLDALTDVADIVFLHMPLTDETRGMFGRAQLARMKPGAYLVNCARGFIVDEAALADALATGQLAGAASDVFESEPNYESPLLAVEGFIATPHAGAQTEASLKRVGIAIADKVLNCLTVPAESRAAEETAKEGTQ
ncbi:NAD(P)-dependent oxidoreductase [Acuticoccus sp. MNP-M23]|uniref:NAD(P)-dependent oxidoreductase n=1 Tax=Acuticoccus sp. MNP-M23 TaxID=3072793 RepID=UPI0028153260|nr:NAD(P)-dependent oxidoreductase [Acuticoccus sp. MNP-M23]WMS44679.1 NAD(P)-dependent oxidoreductase [Acuticoccus sp. MNP-M23]